MAELNNHPQSTPSNLALEDRLHLWFNQNRQTALLAFLAIIVIAAVYTIWYWKKTSAEESASQALATAQTVTDWDKVATSYPGTKSAPLALMLAADNLYSGGKYSDAQAEYTKFLEQYPRHDLAGSAQFGVASCMESQAKTKDDYARAGAAYESLMANYPSDFHAGQAQLAVARCAVAQGDPERARQILENVVASMPNSQSAKLAAAQLAILSRTLTPAAPAQPNLPSLVLPGTSQSTPSIIPPASPKP